MCSHQNNNKKKQISLNLYVFLYQHDRKYKKMVIKKTNHGQTKRSPDCFIH